MPTVLDLSGSAGLTGSLGSIVFTGAYSGNYSGSTGSGRIQPFLRVANTGVEQGFNTAAANPVGINPTATMNDKGGSFSPLVQLNALPVVVKGGVLYYEFLLDAHQNTGLISLDELRFYVTTLATPDPTSLDIYDGASLKILDSKTPSFTGLSPVVDMDGGADSPDATYVKLTSAFNSGSGGPDLFVDVPVKAFGSDYSQYVYMYTKLGVQNGADSTFEEWDHSNNGVSIQLGGQVATVIDEVSPTATVNVTSVPQGAVVLDSSTVSVAAGFPTPTGTVTYNFYNTSTPIYGTTTPVASYVETLSGGIVPVTPDTAPLASGNYSYIAVYGGDTNYVGSVGAVEPLTVNKGNLSFSTTIFDASTNTAITNATAALGSSVYDTSVFSAGLNPAPTVANVTYTWTSSSGTIAAGSGATSLPYVEGPLNAGSYSFQATFAGDSNYFPFTALSEPLVVAKASPTINTVASGSVTIGSGIPITDSATLSGGYNHSGTITFQLYAPDGVTVVYTDVVPVVSGSSVYDTSTGTNPGGYLPPTAGLYEWKAIYSGDINNNPVASYVGDEPVQVNPFNPSISTLTIGSVVIGGGVAMNDTATLSGHNPTGTITFQLYAPNGVTVVYTDMVTVSGNGTYYTVSQGNTLGGYVPTATGLYHWVASYSGDKANNPVSSGTLDEPEQVNQASPTIKTTPGGAVVLGSGTVMKDSATLSGGYNATGTITFTLTAPDGITVVDTETVAVSGNGTYSTPTGYVPTGTGTLTGIYEWLATYSGNSYNRTAADNFGDEPQIVNPATPKITTIPGATVVVGSGAALTDSATLSGGVDFLPGDTITFNLYAPSDITYSSPVYTDVVPITGNGAYSTSTGNNPGGYVPTGTSSLTGNYEWIATFSGDANNSTVSGNRGDEPEKVNPATPTLVTTASVSASGVVGSAIPQDSALLSGGYNLSAGTITFTLTAPDFTQAYQQIVTVTGNGTYTTANVNVATLVGTYTWHASFSGTINNNGANDQGGAAEQVTIIKASPAISTSASETAGGVAGTSLLSDSATVTGGYGPTGTITFTLKAPDGTTTTVGTATVNGDGVYSSLVVTATEVGAYTWHATYNGDSLNNTAADNGTNESLTTIKASPTLVTTASESVAGMVGSAIPQDSAVLSGGYNVSGGTITFTLTAPDGTVADTQVVNVTGDKTYTTSNSNVATQVGTYTWSAVYSGDSLNKRASDQGGTAEQVKTVKASPTLVTTASESANGVVGTAISQDSAVLSGGYNVSGGTITFTLTAPNGTMADTQVVNVTGDGTYTTTNSNVATQVGTYTWTAVYTGDTRNNGASDQGGTKEQVTTIKASPAVNTSASETAGGVVGTSVLSDSAAVTGGDSPTGTITFTLKAPDGTTTTVGTVTITGDGTYKAPTVTATETGTYTWNASYSGDGLNNGAIDNGASESVTTVKASPAISTVASEGGVAGNVTLQDTANLTGGYGPTGTITFTLTAPDGTVADTESVAVTGDATYGTTVGALATQVGTYTWSATYNGDANNNSVTDNGINESAITILTKYAPALVTTATESASGVVGSAVPQDSAVLSGGFLVAEGAATITFTLTAPDGVTVVDTETFTVTGDGSYHTANTVAATQVGVYTWSASYSGNDYNYGVLDQGGPAEQVTTIMASPALVTKASFTSGLLAIPASAVGTALPQDTAVLSGGYLETGTITFTLTAPDGTQVDQEVVKVTGNGTYATANVIVATQVGTYTWLASYGGDNTLNNGALDQGGAAEQVTTIKAGPAINTVAGQIGNEVGSALLSDTATLSGGYEPGGTISFTMKAPDGTITPEGSVTVSGDGTYSSPTPVLATMAGTYSWLATYNGDVNNNVAADNGLNESSSVHVFLKITGFKFYDSNGNGQWDTGEAMLQGWTIQLYQESNGISGLQTGTGGDTLVGSQVTDANGNYSFTNLWSGTYYIREVLQPGWAQTVGNETITTGGNIVDNFGNVQVVVKNEAATMGFWANKNGQKLLKSYTGTGLATWLATSYPNLFGNLAGASSTQVAAYFTLAKNKSGTLAGNLYAQAFTTALNVYVTTSGLGWGTTSASYGFKQAPYGGLGLGSIFFNVGNNGAAFGVANNTLMSVSSLLSYLDAHTVRTGGSYTTLPLFLFFGNNTNLMNGADNVFDGINSRGDIV